MFGIKNNNNGTNNSNIDLFEKISQKAKTQDMSVVKQYFDDQWTASSFYGSGHPLNLNGDANLRIALNAGTKQARISNYRMISNYNEVGEAVDEIADAHMTSHSDGTFVKLAFRDIELSDIAAKELQNQANHYFGLFDFPDNIYEYARKLTVEGELAFENIVDKKDISKGIIDIRYLATETYEFAFDTKAKRKTGLAVMASNPESDADIQSINRNSGTAYGGSPVRTENLNCHAQISAGKIVYLPFEQVTYINSGIYDRTGLIVFPALERARRAYNQLQLIEDAVLIYRWVRSPVRNVFTVDCGKMPPNKAKEYVRELSKSFTSKRTYDPASGSIVGTYDPFTIMENVWIPKGSDGKGVDIGQIGGTASWGQLDDLDYFLRKLYRALKVPASRMLNAGEGSAGTKTIQLSEEITYEEYRFAKYIVRSLSCFARGLKDGLITHLKLTGAWESNKLKEHNILIDIAPPAEIEIYRRMKLLEQKLDLYGKWKGSGLSQKLGKERILGFSQTEISDDISAWKAEQTAEILYNAKLNELKRKGKLAAKGELDKKLDAEIDAEGADSAIDPDVDNEETGAGEESVPDVPANEEGEFVSAAPID
jgi:hypothetical protein